MIHYDLRCAAGHGFDAWFASGDAFEAQAAAGLVSCPHCGLTQVDRGLMAPAIGRAKAGGTDRRPGLPDARRAALQKLRREVEGKCDYVGDRFSEQARRMHEGGIPHKPIYGEATDAQREALIDDGVPVARIPWVDREDA